MVEVLVCDVNVYYNVDVDDYNYEKIELVSFLVCVYLLLDMLCEVKKGNYDILWGV